MEKEELFKIARANIEWFKENYEDLKKKHDKRWIIIHSKKVVDSTSTFNEMMKVARKYDQNTIKVEYIESKQIAMFF